MGQIRVILVAVALLLLAGCAGSGPLAPFLEQGRVWPDPPDAQRIAFVGEFSASADLGIKASVWERIVSFTAGRRRDAMVRPMAVAVSPSGSELFVADPDARCVHRYDLQRGRYRCLTFKGGTTLLSPIGLAVDGDGRLFISDSQLRGIYTLSPGGKWLESLELDTTLLQPTGIAWEASSGLLHVTDTGSQSIKAFSATGKLVRELGERGANQAQFNFPTYLWSDESGELVVTDSLNFRVQRFDREGMFLHAFGRNGDQPGDFSRPKGVAVDCYGHVYVVDALFHAVQVFDRQGALMLTWGKRGRESGEFWLPNGIFVSRDNTIFVADSYNKRVQVFRYVGADSCET